MIDDREENGKESEVKKDKKWFQNQVMYNGMTYKDAVKEFPSFHKWDYDNLKKCRNKFLMNSTGPPLPKHNIFIEGEEGVGKSILSESLAKALADPEGKMIDDNIFFFSKKSNLLFEGYDGQPVVIWDSCLADELLKYFHGRKNLLNFFDPFSAKSIQKVKHGHTGLINKINIINSTQPFNFFISALVKNGDRNSIYKNFPLQISLYDNYFEFSFSKKFYEDIDEYNIFKLSEKIQGSVWMTASRCGNNYELRHELLKRMFQPVIEICRQKDETEKERKSD